LRRRQKYTATAQRDTGPAKDPRITGVKPMSSETDLATADDLINEGGKDVHGRCGQPDTVCPCADSSFNRWRSGSLDFANLKSEGWKDEEIADRTAQYSGHPSFRLRRNSETIAIHPDRVAMGDWNCGKKSGDGDIYAAYSADRISEGKPVRTPFEWSGSLWVTVSICGKGLTHSGKQEFQAYRIIPSAMFNGVATTYAKKAAVDHGEAARNDPLGFYNSMQIVCHGKAWVMQGPPTTFVADMTAERPPHATPEPAQMSLFS